MKYYLSLMLLLSAAIFQVQAQNTNAVGNTGNVGIGTTTPTDLLQVNGGNIRVSNPAGYPFGVAVDVNYTSATWAREFGFAYGSTGKLAAFGVYANSGTMNYAYIGGSAATTAHLTPWMVFKPNGYIGIGTVDPFTTFSVNGAVSIYSAVASTAPRPPVSNGTITGEIRGTNKDWYGADDGFLRISAGGGSNSNTKSFIDLSGYTSNQLERYENIILGTAGLERMKIAYNGNIGIGTSNPTAKLAVNGDIKATRVKVTTNAADWPDYVFSTSYQLPGLLQLEEYIRKHQHLPGVPSAEEVKKEGSADLGSMNEILLRKVEELTLYMIELKKENTALKGRIESLETKR